jgi:glyoxylase-like metal-dependent hydrolase (beta-lactamase superfamily II)
VTVETMTVGSASVTAFLDAEGPFFMPLAEAFPTVEQQLLDAAQRLDPGPHAGTDTWWLAFRMYVLEAAGRVILVDTGAASATPLRSGWAPEGRHVAERLATELGIEADRVTDVVLTHLHGDHTAGSVDAEGLPAFPEATYHLQTRELESAREAGPDTAMWRHLVVPLAAADQLHTCTGATDLVTGLDGLVVRLQPTPGHTPGHQSVVVSGTGDHLVIAGDAFVHAAQVVDPATRYLFDQDADDAVRSRVALLEQARELGAPLGSAHLQRAFIAVRA